MSGWGSNFKPSSRPRRPASAYAYYIQDMYRYQTRTTGARDAATIFPMLYEEWKGKSVEDKYEYEQRAMLDKERYQQEMIQYYKLIRDGVLQPEPQRPRKTDQPGYPRMTRNAYVFFSNAVRREIRNENPDMPYVDVMKEIGRRWKGLDEDEKEEYFGMRNADRHRYRTLRRRFTEEEKLRKRQEGIRKDRERLMRLAKKVFQHPIPTDPIHFE